MLKPHHKKLIRYLPLAIIALFTLILFITGLHEHLSFEMLKDKQEALKTFAMEHPLIAPLIFIAVFVVSVCLLLPDALVLCLIAGFLFPKPIALLYVGFSEAVGSTLFFLAIYAAFGKDFGKKRDPLLNKIEKRLKENEASYLLFLRFSHLLPNWMISTASACLGVRLWTFFWTTFLGFLPLAFVFIETGKGLDKLFQEGGEVSLRSIFNTQVQVSLLALALFALLPILIKKWRKKYNE